MKTLKSKEGYYLTQSADVAIQERTITDCIYLPDTADESEWVEITEDQKAEYVKKLETYNASLTSTTKETDNSLSVAIEKKLHEITDYDNSQAVNNFTYKGVNAWFTPDERKGYEQSILSCETLGITEISVPLAGNIIKMPVADAKVMLAKIHLYADACTLVTMQHKAEVEMLTTVSEVEAYDITKGYPDKLAF
jgi:hypothetical protein